VKLSQLIKEAQAILAAEGDLDVLSEDHYALSGLRVEEAEGLPADWDLPDGTKFVMAHDMR